MDMTKNYKQQLLFQVASHVGLSIPQRLQLELVSELTMEFNFKRRTKNSFYTKKTKRNLQILILPEKTRVRRGKKKHNSSRAT